MVTSVAFKDERYSLHFLFGSKNISGTMRASFQHPVSAQIASSSVIRSPVSTVSKHAPYSSQQSHVHSELFSPSHSEANFLMRIIYLFSRVSATL